jgi:hypothetical protein
VTELLLGTVTTSTASVVSVTVDGAASEVAAIVPLDLSPNLYGSTAVGARVIGYQVGKRFYVTDLISGGAATTFTGSQAGGVWGVSPVTFATWNTGNGILNVSLSISGYNAAPPGPVTCILYMDGSTTGFSTNLYCNQLEHLTLPTLVARVAVTAGAHTMQTAVLMTNDTNDILRAIGWMTGS